MPAVAPWDIDPDALRTTLDELRKHLQRPIFVAPALDRVHYASDFDRVHSSLQEVLNGLANIDLDARRALSSVSRPSVDGELAKRLGGLLSDLSNGWYKLVAARLSPQRMEALRRLLAHESPDWLSMLHRKDDENAHSDVLCWLLDQRKAPNVAPRVLNGLVDYFETPDAWREAVQRGIQSNCISVRREFVYGREWSADESRDRIDLVVSGPGFVFAIENKLWAAEHEGQTEAYWQWLSGLRGLRGGLFLSPSGVPPRCSYFRPLSYLQLLGCLLDAPATVEAPITAQEEHVLGAYVKTLARTALRCEIRAISRTGTY
jgi:hypothetical protein